MLASILLALPLVVSTFAMPAARQADVCQGLGAQTLSNAFNFTLAAFNASSTTPIPLVFTREGSVNSEVANGVLSTAAAYSEDVFPNFSLVNGTLIPNQDYQSAVDMPVTAGQRVNFWYTQSALQQYLPAAASQYCVVLAEGNSGYADAVLHVDGDATSFYACMDEEGFNSIVYKPASDNDGLYDYGSCEPVTIKLE